jgi:hypothetical protein
MASHFPLFPENGAQDMKALLALIDDLSSRVEALQDSRRKTILRTAIVEIRALIVATDAHNRQRRNGTA